mmetsp:Transcript_37110/g.41799  ORF Transcript_37110/g.41799 Transcript_37110/m.41799 type:complete len:107 (+) Transcript_37110:199-519(+)
MMQLVPAQTGDARKKPNASSKDKQTALFSSNNVLATITGIWYTWKLKLKDIDPASSAIIPARIVFEGMKALTRFWFPHNARPSTERTAQKYFLPRKSVLDFISGFS